MMESSETKMEKEVAGPIYFSTIACGIFSILLGLMVAAGWHANTITLIQIIPAFRPMQYTTAICFALGGFGLIAVRFRRRWISAGIAGVILTVSALTLCEYLFKIDLKIDLLLMKPHITVLSPHPGRMTPNTALSFLFIGLALMIASFIKIRESRYAKLLFLEGLFGSLVVAMGLMVFFTYLFQLKDVFLWEWGVRMAAHSSIGFMILGIGIVAFSWRKENAHIPFVLVLTLGMMFSILAYFALSNAEQKEFEEGFYRKAQDRFSVFAQEMESTKEMVRSLWAFYNSSQKVERHEFHRFTKTALENKPAFHALGWVPVVEGKKRDSYEKEARESDRDFQIMESTPRGLTMPAGRREIYYPVQYLEPERGYEILSGLNLASYPTLGAAIQESRDTGRMIASGKISLPLEGAVDPDAFFIFKPLYMKGREEDSAGWRRSHLVGYAVGIFRIGDLVESVLKKLSPAGVDLYLFDKSAPAGERFLYQHFSAMSNEIRMPVTEKDLTLLTGLHLMQTYDIGGRRWLVLDIPTKELLATRRTWLPWGAFFAILYISFLLAYYLWANIQKTSIIEKAVQTRTAELSKAKEDLEHQISEREMSEERLREVRAAMEHAVEGISCLDRQGMFISVNKACADMFGYSPSEMIGMVWEDTVAPQDRDKMRFVIRDMLEFGKGETALRAVRKDGSIFDEQVVMVRTHDQEKRYTGYYAFVKDVSERKFKEALEVKAEMIAMVSHELRSPLHSLREGISVVLEGLVGEINEEQRDALETAKRNADRLARLVNHVLDFQKLEAGVVAFSHEPVDINEVVDEVKAYVTPLIRQKNLDLNLETDRALPVVSCDRDRITQVLLNLVNNAIKFTEKGSVHISTKRKDESVMVSVKDTGVGIKPEDVQRLFRKFGQLESGKLFGRGGTGLGLAISKRIIDRHHGQIWVESVYQEGSMFSFAIPLEKSPANL